MTYRHFNRVSGVVVGIVLAAQIVGLFAFPAVAFAVVCESDNDCGPAFHCDWVVAQKECIAGARDAETIGPANQPTDTPGADAEADAADAAPQESVGFIPLTDLPGLREVANSSTLPVFLNNLYKLCIGAAAVLAVLQIMRGGITYMLGDSITEKKEARTLMLMSVVGLLLVLSPVIVFGLIDSRILSLQLNFGTLAPAERAGVAPDVTVSDMIAVCSRFSEDPERMVAVTEFEDGSLPGNASTWDYGPSSDVCDSTCSTKTRSGSDSRNCSTERDPENRNSLMYCDCRPYEVSRTQHTLESVTVTTGGEQYTLSAVRSVVFANLGQCEALTAGNVRNYVGGGTLSCDSQAANYAACDAAVLAAVNGGTLTLDEVECAAAEL